MTIITASIISTLTFVAAALLVLVEENKGRRLVLVRVRHWLDVLIENAKLRLVRFWHGLIRRGVLLSWYYSMHAFLKLSLQFLASVYFAMEQILVRNREKAKRLRREQRESHLTVLSDNRKETALTEKEKNRRKKEALKG